MLSFRELKIFKGYMRIFFTLILVVLVQLALSTGPDRTGGGEVDDSREAPGKGIVSPAPAPAGDAKSGALPRDLARFRVIPVTGAGITPVSVSLEGINYNTDKGRIALYEPGRGGREIPSQVERGIVTRLWFMYDNIKSRRFLNALSGPNGEKIEYYRIGSCCPFETKNSEWGGISELYFDGKAMSPPLHRMAFSKGNQLTTITS
jgi:hypothetical protein